MALTPEHRGVRLDVEVNETLTDEDVVLNVYDIESHLQNDTDFPHHNRFYQAKIDARYLKSGEKNWCNLPDLYVITITDYDPFGKDYMVYTVRNKCEEDPDVQYNDGLKFYYFNSTGTKGGSLEIKELLLYLQNSTEENAVNEELKKIHHYVNKVKLRPEVREAYMRFDEIIECERADAKEEANIEIKTKVILQILEEYGEVSRELREFINNQKDAGILDKMLKTAIETRNINQFAEKIGMLIN